MWDEATGSAWSHLDGAALAGPLEGEQLAILPLQTTTWEAWVEQHPQTTVPDIDTGHGYRRVSLGRAGISRTFRETLDGVDERLPENELVIGVLAGDGAAAFPVEAAVAAPMQGGVGGVPVVVLEDARGIPTLAYHRALSDGRVLDFERVGEAGSIVDVQTGSRWSSGGLALDGELAGVQLTFVTSFLTEWYGWAAFHPETVIYDPDD
jgi:hypothetical protein